MAATYDSLGLKYTPPASSFAGTGSPLPVLLYFYHTDHLGPSSLVTTDGGYVTQHVEYVPFGEVFIEERDNETWSTPYKFNGKELDEETGLYYYGARYYDPRVSLWLGVDPLAEKYPNVGGYVYCVENPINAIDPDGKRVYFVAGAGLDTKGWRYTERWGRAFEKAGIKGFTPRCRTNPFVWPPPTTASG